MYTSVEPTKIDFGKMKVLFDEFNNCQNEELKVLLINNIILFSKLCFFRDKCLQMQILGTLSIYCRNDLLEACDSYYEFLLQLTTQSLSGLSLENACAIGVPKI